MTTSHRCALPLQTTEEPWTCPRCGNRWVATNRLSILALPLLLVLWGESIPPISQQQLTGDSVEDHIRNSSGWGEEKQENLRWTFNLVGPATVLLLILLVFAA